MQQKTGFDLGRAVHEAALVLSGALLALGIGALSSARAAEPDNFRVRTTADFVALCETQPNQENYVAAIHFCHGFASGAYQYYQATSERDPAQRFVCAPTPPPTRNQAIAGFLTWVRAHPDVMSANAVDTMFRYLGETYPCRGAAAPQRR